jgi:hypothetical protein
LEVFREILSLKIPLLFTLGAKAGFVAERRLVLRESPECGELCLVCAQTYALIRWYSRIGQSVAGGWWCVG